MTRVAYFGYDSANTNIRRRVEGFQDDGVAVTGFMMRRNDGGRVDWDNVDLGRTFDGAYIQRVRSIFSGAKRAAAAREKLAECDVILARNLDMLATALLAKKYTGARLPVIYECLDVHRLLTRHDPIGFLFRRFEGWMLSKCACVVVSSPGFEEHYFQRRHRGKYAKAVLIDNRLSRGVDLGPRPAKDERARAGKLRIGWLGMLRCRRSLDILLNVAREFPDEAEVHLHGLPALTEIPDFDEKVRLLPNLIYHGRYKWPDDLARLYGDLDVVWAGDFWDAGYNSVWLLPNRLYEGGYYAVPPIAPKGTQTARWAMDRGVGFEASEDLMVTLPELVGRLIADRRLIAEKREKLLSLPDNHFVQPRGVHSRLVAEVLRGRPRPEPTLVSSK